MKLSSFIDECIRNTQKFPDSIKVIGNGYGTSNVPDFATGVAFDFDSSQGTYKVRFKDSNIESERFHFFGGMSMNLDVVMNE